MAIAFDPAGFWKDGLIVIPRACSSPAGGGHLEAPPCIPNHLVWISFNWIDKCKEGKIGVVLLAASSAGFRCRFVHFNSPH